MSWISWEIQTLKTLVSLQLKIYKESLPWIQWKVEICVCGFLSWGVFIGRIDYKLWERNVFVSSAFNKDLVRGYKNEFCFFCHFSQTCWSYKSYDHRPLPDPFRQSSTFLNPNFRWWCHSFKWSYHSKSVIEKEQEKGIKKNSLETSHVAWFCSQITHWLSVEGNFYWFERQKKKKRFWKPDSSETIETIFAFIKSYSNILMNLDDGLIILGMFQ